MRSIRRKFTKFHLPAMYIVIPLAAILFILASALGWIPVNIRITRIP